LIKLLNNEGPILDAMREGNTYLQPPEHSAAQYRPQLYVSSQPQALHSYDAHKQTPLLAGDEDELFPGYTTHDDAGKDGDDTIHSAIHFYQVPNCIQASIGFKADEGEMPKVVDVMYNEFIQKWILLGLGYLGESYTLHDTHLYADGKSFTSIMTDWVKEHWNVAGEKCP
jgi:hypothetical protein